MRSLFFAVLVAAPLAAQNPPAPPTPAPPRPTQSQRDLRAPVADTGIFSPAPLPPANELRRPDGKPGPRYWQQRADYTIKATLDTTRRRIDGTVTIRYTNNSPDTLERVWLQLDQNLFRQGSVGSFLNAQESRFGGAGFNGGFEISHFTMTPVPEARRGRPAVAQAKPAPVKNRVDDTMMDAELPTPLPPGGVALFTLDYGFNIPDHGADRMGRDGSLYELAQWYPRMCVYDDIHGWNTTQYLGQGEFYLEYGNFDYEVTLPAGYIVAGTGTVQNPLEVLTATQRARLAAALKSDTITHIVTEQELQSGGARPKKDGTLTWRFRAENVRDVAWAASPEYLWDASGWNGVLAQAYYRPGVQYPLVPLPLPANLGGGGAGVRHGVPDGCHGGEGRDQGGPLQRRHPRDRPHVVSDDGRIRRAALRLDGRRLQYIHQHLLRGRLLQAGRQQAQEG